MPAADFLRSARQHFLREFKRIPPLVWAVAGVALSLGACIDTSAAQPFGEIAKLALSNAPGILAAIGIAIRAQGKIKITDAERERIAAAAHAEAVATMAQTVRSMRADLDLAQGAASEALRRERDAESRARKLDARCDSLKLELDEVRRILRSGGIAVGG